MTINRNSSELTIVIPTHNRAMFLRRQLLFLSQMQVKHRIAIYDSSERSVAQENLETIAAANDLNIDHVVDSSPVLQKCRHAVDAVKTRYTVFCADDDFLMPDAIVDCVDFLEAKSDYASATGSWVSLSPEKNNRCNQGRCYSIDDPNPLVRFRQLYDCWFPTFYVVYRTEPLRRGIAITDESCDSDRARVFPEVMLGQLTVLYGKLAVLPRVHLLRELHSANESKRTPFVSDVDSYDRLHKQFMDTLSQQIREVCRVSPGEAQAAVAQCYGGWNHADPNENFRKTGWDRLRKNVISQIYLMRDRIVDDQTNIWIRRSFNGRSALAATPAWRLAFELMTRYPAGMQPDAIPQPIAA